MSEAFGRRLRELRKASGLTQEAVADQLGYNGKSTVSQYESGKNEPSYDTLVKMARLFSVSTDYLLGNTDDPIHMHRDTPFLQVCGERLRALRLQRGLTCQQVVAQVGLDEGMPPLSAALLGAYELGKREPTLLHLRALAALFGVTLDHLSGKQQDEPPPERFSELRDKLTAGRIVTDAGSPLATDEREYLLFQIKLLMERHERGSYEKGPGSDA